MWIQGNSTLLAYWQNVPSCDPLSGIKFSSTNHLVFFLHLHFWVSEWLNNITLLWILFIFIGMVLSLNFTSLLFLRLWWTVIGPSEFLWGIISKVTIVHMYIHYTYQKKKKPKYIIATNLSTAFFPPNGTHFWL